LKITKLNGKGKQEEPKKNNAKRNFTITSMLHNDPIVPLSEVLEKLPLLPWEIFTADMSRCDNEGA